MFLFDIKYKIQTIFSNFLTQNSNLVLFSFTYSLSRAKIDFKIESFYAIDSLRYLLTLMCLISRLNPVHSPMINATLLYMQLLKMVSTYERKMHDRKFKRYS